MKMTGAYEMNFTVSPDVTRLYALAAIIEKHAGALRADLEEFMKQDAYRQEVIQDAGNVGCFFPMDDASA